MGCHSHDDRDSRYPVSSIDLSVFYSCRSIQVMDNDLHTHTHTLIQNNSLHINHSADNDAFLFIVISSSITNDTHFCVCV